MPAGPTARWSMDVVHDALADGSQRGVQLDFSRPGKPVEDAFIESAVSFRDQRQMCQHSSSVLRT